MREHKSVNEIEFQEKVCRAFAALSCFVTDFVWEFEVIGAGLWALTGSHPVQYEPQSCFHTLAFLSLEGGGGVLWLEVESDARNLWFLQMNEQMEDKTEPMPFPQNPGVPAQSTGPSNQLESKPENCESVNHRENYDN